MEENVEFLNQLIEKAFSNEHTEKELLTNIDSLLIAKDAKCSIRKIYKTFKKCSRKLYNAYIKSKRLHKTDYSLLSNSSIMKMCYSFYKIEYLELVHEISEYHEYMFHGHIIDTIVGNTRIEEDMYDFLGGTNE